MSETAYDIVIVGGGIVGYAMACALANTHYHVKLLEAQPRKLDTPEAPTLDKRTLALSHTTLNILNSLGILPHCQHILTDIKHVHVSDQGHFGFARIAATDYQLPRLGATAEIIPLAQQLAQHVPDDVVYAPATVEGIEQDDTGVTLTVNGSQLRTKLVIAADGANSFVRKACHIGTTVMDYHQHAVVSNVQISQNHNGCAYERFTQNGPFALLPIAPHTMGLVYTVPSDQAEAIRNQDDKTFLTDIQQQFGHRLGLLKDVGKRVSYPLKLTVSDTVTKDRVILIGNAAQSLHPVMGQGFNLGIRDVAHLTDFLINQGLNNLPHWRNDYLNARQKDRQDMVKLTNRMVDIFTNPLWPVQISRGLGLAVLNRLPYWKHRLGRRLMGMIRPSKAMMLGLPTEAVTLD